MAQDELVVVVDADNRVVGRTTRAEMRRDALIHRASYVYVFGSFGLLYVHLRTMTKDVYPGYWDLCAGGVVLDGETYEESAARELSEELGITGVPIDPWFPFYFEEGRSRVWGYAFGVVYDGPLRPQEEEVECVEMVNPRFILSGEDSRLWTPDSMLALRKRFEPVMV